MAATEMAAGILSDREHTKQLRRAIVDLKAFGGIGCP